jgi:hypothetical protein
MQETMKTLSQPQILTLLHWAIAAILGLLSATGTGAAWATPKAGDACETGNTEKQQAGWASLTRQAWATPQASDNVEGARTAADSNQKCLGRDEVLGPTLSVITRI